MSIQASEWARRQYVGDAYGKAVLRSVADYANEEGLCWPSLARLAGDCELSQASIRRKLKDLEEAGFLTRIKCWMDDQGRRNHEGRGRETSSDIRIIFSKTSVRPDTEQKSAEGLQADTPPLQADTPPLAVESPPNEPSLKKEESPQTPLRGALEEKREAFEDREFETQWAEFRSACYPDGIIDIEAARREMRKCSPDRRRAGILGLPAYADYLRRRKQKSKAAHLYWRKGLWEGLSASPAAQSGGLINYSPHSPDGRALAALARIARYDLWRLSDGSIPYHGTISRQLMALANAPEETVSYPQGTPNYGAWRRLIDEVFAGRPLPALPTIEAPYPWPPSIDGKIYTADSTGPSGKTMAEQDAEFIEQHGLG